MNSFPRIDPHTCDSPLQACVFSVPMVFAIFESSDHSHHPFYTRTSAFPSRLNIKCFPVSQTAHWWGSILGKKELATLTGRGSEPCGWALCRGLLLWAPWLGSVSRPCPPLVLCGWALCPRPSLCPGLVPLVLCCSGLVWLGSVAGLCALVLLLNSELCCPPLGCAPELCGWALCPGLVPGLSVSRPCPPLLLLFAAVCGWLVLCLGRALSSLAGVFLSCPSVVLPWSSSCPAVVFLLSFSCPPEACLDRARLTMEGRASSKGGVCLLTPALALRARLAGVCVERAGSAL